SSSPPPGEVLQLCLCGTISESKGDNVKRAAKQLRTCLSWRESIGADYLMADELSGELSDGLAYVAGHDDEYTPVFF
ncbi:hypothetical protein VIGAN_10191600, partial [Vigna angularis var. angularis]